MRDNTPLRMGVREQQTTAGMTLRANRIKKSLDYTKMENPLYVGQQNEMIQTTGGEINYDQQSLRSIGNKDESLVKHMRNLPGYLQRAEKGENIQGKALNFGVLDWGRLENWKSNEKRIPPRYKLKTSDSSKSLASVETGSVKLLKNKKTLNPLRRNQPPPKGSPLNSPGVRWPRGKPVKAQLSETSPCSNDLPSGNKYQMVELDTSIAKQVDQMSSEKETSSDLKQRGSCHSTDYIKTASADDINHVDDPCHSGNQNDIPSSPDLLPRSSSSPDLWLSDSRISRDDRQIEANENRLSRCFSPEEFRSLSPFSDVPHSCPFPLPLSSETNLEPGEIPFSSLPVVESRKGDMYKDEQHFVKGRQLSSPNRRFSFSLGKMARSFSFKDNSTSSSVPKLSPAYTSVKSGPVNAHSSPDLNKQNWKNENATTPSRSSPLRRFLDPLLKLKGSQLAEKVQKSNLDPSPISAATPVNKIESLQNKKQRPSNVQALLQLTLNNGIPFFKLVVESSSDILAAAVKKLPSGKDDSSLIYAFYSVHETKKKSGGWIYQGSKEKSLGFGYNIVGQMKISSSYHAEFSGSEKDLYVVRESVLYSTDVVQADQKTVDCTLDGELAAIIVKNPSHKTCGDIGSSKSTVVILPEGVHSWPNSVLPSPIINRWRSGGECDCGGWDIGCQFHVLSHQDENVKTSSPSMLCATSDRLDLCYQVGPKNKCSFRLVSLEDGLHSLEYDPSMSLLQAFSICVAVVSSQKLTHMFQVSYVPESENLSKHVTTGDEKAKNQEEFISKPPLSPVSRV